MTNIDPGTGIHYGYISATSLDPEIVDELTQGCSDQYKERLQEFKDDIRSICENQGFWGRSITAMVEYAEELFDDEYQDNDEATHQFQRNGVIGRTSWLGGALHVWIFSSPHTGMFEECSPCVPNAGNLDRPKFDGVLAYDVPAKWRVSDDS